MEELLTKGIMIIITITIIIPNIFALLSIIIYWILWLIEEKRMIKQEEE